MWTNFWRYATGAQAAETDLFVMLRRDQYELNPIKARLPGCDSVLQDIRNLIESANNPELLYNTEAWTDLRKTERDLWKQYEQLNQDNKTVTGWLNTWQQRVQMADECERVMKSSATDDITIAQWMMLLKSIQLETGALLRETDSLIKQLISVIAEDAKIERKRNDEKSQTSTVTELVNINRMELKTAYQHYLAIFQMGDYFKRQSVIPALIRATMQCLLETYLGSPRDIVCAIKHGEEADKAESRLAIKDSKEYVKTVLLRFSKCGKHGLREALRTEYIRLYHDGKSVPTLGTHPRQLSREEHIEELWQYHLLQEAVGDPQTHVHCLMKLMQAATTATEDAWSELCIEDYSIEEWYYKTKEVAAKMDFKSFDRLSQNQQSGFYAPQSNGRGRGTNNRGRGGNRGGGRGGGRNEQTNV